MQHAMNPLTMTEDRRAGHPSTRILGVRTVVGTAIGAFRDDVLELRARVLAGWPYLWDGASPLEGPQTLQACLDSWRSVAVLAFDGDTLVGAATGLPLADDGREWREAALRAGIDPSRIFHFSGSVLLPAYRGRGLGHRFFDERESHARIIGGFDLTAFWAVEREPDHPRRPPFGRGHDGFWHKRGYSPRPQMAMDRGWSEEDAGVVAHPMACWARPLERAR